MVMRSTPSIRDKPIVPTVADEAVLAVMNYTEMESKVHDATQSSANLGFNSNRRFGRLPTMNLGAHPRL